MLISVLVCSYNSADTLGAALDSALEQASGPLEERDFEVILVDDGSNDDTSTVAQERMQIYPNLRYLPLPGNQGLAPACNHGLNEAEGEYLIRLDADDQFCGKALSALAGPLDRNETDLVYSDRYDVDLAGGSRALVQVEPFNLFKLIAIGTMFRTEMVRKVGGYRPLFWEEYDLYLRYMLESGRPPVRIPEPLYCYSRHPASMTANPANVADGWGELKRAWGGSVLEEFGWTKELEGTTS